MGEQYIMLNSDGVVLSDTAKKIAETFGVGSENKSFQIKIPDFSVDYKVGLITGSSGSGKSIIAHCKGDCIDLYSLSVPFTECCIFDVFLQIGLDIGYDDANVVEMLRAVGLNNLRNWFVRFDCLSCGEKYRVRLLLVFLLNFRVVGDFYIDEFGSDLDDLTFLSVITSFVKLWRNGSVAGNRLIIVSHRDVYLPNFDFIYDCDNMDFSEWSDNTAGKKNKYEPPRKKKVK